MADFGQCNEPLCNKNAVRLFDCAHHCMKLICLEHLIEHDRLIEHNRYLDNARTELKELWITYSLLTDETKLYFEYEQKLQKHQQLIKDLTNLFKNNSINNMEQYKFMLERLEQNIEHSTESFPLIEPMKIKSIDENSSNDELDLLDVNLATRIKKLNKHVGKKKRKSNEDNHDILNPSIRKLSGKCPLSFNGAYGLTEEHHGMYLCSQVKSYQELYRHLVKFHKLTLPSIQIICQAIQNDQDPSKEILFQSNDNVIDKINQTECPFSVYNNNSLIQPNSSQRFCRRLKPQFGVALRHHLINFHRMNSSNADKLISKLKNNCI